MAVKKDCKGPMPPLMLGLKIFRLSKMTASREVSPTTSGSLSQREGKQRFFKEVNWSQAWPMLDWVVPQYRENEMEPC
jgi:hypothetical protein